MMSTFSGPSMAHLGGPRLFDVFPAHVEAHILAEVHYFRVRGLHVLSHLATVTKEMASPAISIAGV